VTDTGRPRSAGSRTGVLRVASYNVRDLKDDSAAAARVVRALSPDVLCLQEIPRYPLSGHRVASFADACGMLFGGGHQGSGGTTVFTSLRMEVASSTHRRLPVGFLARTRGYAVAQVALPGCSPVLVVSAHLGLDAAERVRHVQAMLGRLQAPMPTIVGADLNEPDGGPAWRSLTSLRPVTGPSPTFPARAPRARIDAVFATADLRRVDGPPVLLVQADLAAASDHLPVWVDLAVR